MAQTATAQSTSIRTLPIEEFANVARVVQSPELADAMHSIGRFQPSNLSMLAGKLLRVSLREDVERSGKIVRTSTKVIEGVKGQPGYFFIKGKESIAALDNYQTTKYQIHFLNLWEMAGRLHTEYKPKIGSDSISDTTGYISELKLSGRFDDALAPGASWSYEKTYETETSSFRGIDTRKSGGLTYVSEKCNNGPAAPASELHPTLSGMMIPVHCQSAASTIGDSARFAYLRDYGFFMPISRGRATTQHTDVSTVSYTIIDLELEPLPVKSN